MFLAQVGDLASDTTGDSRHLTNLEIRVEALRAVSQVPEAARVAKRLASRGVRVEGRHVQQVYEAHGLQPGKVSVRSMSYNPSQKRNVFYRKSPTADNRFAPKYP
jgi:hypothetical protein